MVIYTEPNTIDYGTCREYNTTGNQYITITAQTLDNIYAKLTTLDKYAYLMITYEINNAEYGLMLVFKKDYIYLYSGPMEDKNLVKKWSWASDKPFYISFYYLPSSPAGSYTGLELGYYYMAFNYNSIETRVLLGRIVKLVKACYHGNIEPTPIYYDPTPPTEIPEQSEEKNAITTTFDNQALMKTMEEMVKAMMNIIQPMMSVMMITMMISMPMTMMRMISEMTSSM
jgi:hypothetical protein